MAQQLRFCARVWKVMSLNPTTDREEDHEWTFNCSASLLTDCYKKLKLETPSISRAEWLKLTRVQPSLVVAVSRCFSLTTFVYNVVRNIVYLSYCSHSVSSNCSGHFSLSMHFFPQNLKSLFGPIIHAIEITFLHFLMYDVNINLSSWLVAAWFYVLLHEWLFKWLVKVSLNARKIHQFSRKH